MKNRVTIVICTVFAVLLCSCQNQKVNTVTSQEASIDSYITKSHEGKEVYRNNGSNRVVLVYGEGDSIVVGDKAKLQLKGYIFSSGPGTQFCDTTVTRTIGSGELISGLDNGLVGAKEGENSYIIFSAKYGFYDKSVGIVPSLSPLLYDVTVISIEKAK